MKPALWLLSALLVSAALPAFAQTQMAQSQYAQTETLPADAAMTDTNTVPVDPVMAQIVPLQNEWARIKYQVGGKDAKLTAIHVLEQQAANITAANPTRAEPKIWEAIILSTDAGIVKGMSALPKVTKAKELLEASLQLDSKALDGSAHTSLGSLYYQVPSWPIAFGDNKKAEKHLKTALQLNPTGIDPNFFYGDFLLQADRADEATIYLNKALQAPPRAGRQVADAGRIQEIKAALAKATAEQAKEKKGYN